MIRKGDNIMSGIGFKTRELGDWKIVHDTDMFENKRVVLFSLPGAFTPTCSTQQLPKYEELYDEIVKYDIDEVYCVSVNDSFVMNAWFDSLEIEKVKAVPDGSGNFTRWVKMLVDKENLGFGFRSWRYSAIINNGEVEEVWVEPGFENCAVGDPYEVSDPWTILKWLKLWKNGNENSSL